MRRLKRTLRRWKLSSHASIASVGNYNKLELVEKGLRYHIYKYKNIPMEYREVYGRKSFNGPLVLLRVEWRRRI